eukprot:5927519-Amphidinium_carterae.1
MGRTQSVPTAIQTDCSAWRVSTPKAAMQSAQRHRAAITSPSPQLDSTLESAWVARTASLSHMMSSTSTRCAKAPEQREGEREKAGCMVTMSHDHCIGGPLYIKRTLMI